MNNFYLRHRTRRIKRYATDEWKLFFILYKIPVLHIECALEVVVDFKKVKANSKWGVIPFQIDDSGKVSVLIISTRRKNWSLPKGNLIRKIGPQRTALLEAYEEAGIDGILGPKPMLCTSGRICIYFFPMKVTKVYEDWPESDFRKRKWIEINKAKNMLHHREMRKILKKFFPKKD